ncbi:MAG: lysoplasmalogenase [Firmicutes bacterium]|nr:lysoplasmalogenase [Bacillota bacterium]
MISLLFLVLYILCSLGDCLWADKRSRLKNGTLEEASVKSFYLKLYTRRFRVLKFTLMPLLLCFYLASSYWGWPFAISFLPKPPLIYIVLALLFGWLGDILLELSSRYFALGLASFLLGHIFYCLAFFLSAGAGSIFSADSVMPFILLGLLAALCVLYSVLMIRHLLFLPQTSKLRLPLVLYLFMLILLVFSSGIFLFMTRSAGALICLIGALLFITSDSILAFRLFKNGKERWIMPTYTLAQLAIILGMLIG